ncbi:MAG TPA: hypothetical protein VEJ63_14020 [Planctomycetota bacterium]|nr:hypothetical protein [Planctomycetota bacterium]
MDYIGGLLLIAMPWIGDFARGGAETWTFVIIGAAMIAMAMITDYECGLLDGMKMSTHLFMDAIAGAVLALSPWLFGFSDFVWMPHLIFGVLEIGAALMTRTVPEHHALMYRERHV